MGLQHRKIEKHPSAGPLSGYADLSAVPRLIERGEFLPGNLSIAPEHSLHSGWERPLGQIPGTLNHPHASVRAAGSLASPFNTGANCQRPSMLIVSRVGDACRHAPAGSQRTFAVNGSSAAEAGRNDAQRVNNGPAILGPLRKDSTIGHLYHPIFPI
jgi:hypothetical protein